MESAHSLVMSLIDHGEESSVLSAILKYHLTERLRETMDDAMDIHAGKAICLGPKNYLARAYQAIPVSITVEGANILTRCMIIFGQGVMRCHPYVLEEVQASQDNDLKRFDKALFAHLGFLFSNTMRALFLSLTRARFVKAPAGKTKRFYQLLTRFSTALAFVSDISMLVLGGDLKRRENISARLGDVLSLLFLASATLKRYVDDGEPEEDLCVVQLAVRDALYNMQLRLDEITRNFPAPLVGRVMRLFVFPRGKHLMSPSVLLNHKVARLILNPTPTRERITAGLYVEVQDGNPIGLINQAFEEWVAVEPIFKKIKKAVKKGVVPDIDLESQIKAAVKAGVINKKQGIDLKKANELRQVIIAVDDFDSEELACH